MDRKARGVSPIVASLMLIVITVSAFGLTLGFVNSWISVQRTGPLLGLRERFIVEDVYFNLNQTAGAPADQKIVSIYIRNVSPSGVGVSVATLAINSTSVPQIRSSSGWRRALSIVPSEGGWLNGTYAWVSGSVHIIRLETERGSRVEVVSKA